MKNNLLKKLASLSIGTVISLLIGVISIPIITRIFTPEDIGIFSIYNTVINLFATLVMFGHDQSYVRFFYEEKKENRKYLLKNILVIPSLIFTILFVITLFFWKSISLYMFSEINIYYYLLILLGIFLLVIRNFSFYVVRMKQDLKFYSVLLILIKGLDILLILSMLKFLKLDFKIMIFSNILLTMITMIIAIYYEKSEWEFLKRSKEKLKHNKKEIFIFSFPLVATMLINWLFQSFDKIALKQWSTLAEVGIYASAFKIVALLNVVQTTFTTFWTPVAYEHYEKNKKDTKFFSIVSQGISIIMFIVAIGTIMFKDLIILMLGQKFRDASFVMPFLIFIPLMYTISETTQIGINFKKKVKWHLVIAVISAGVNVIGNYYFVPSLGAKGAAISTGVSYIIFFLLRTYFSLRYYKVNYELKKLSFYIVLTFGYALYNTFVDNWLISGFSGIVIIGIILGMNFKFIKEQLKLIRK